MKKSLNLSQYVVAVVEHLAAHGYEAYIVGGAVRDALLDRQTHDWDVTTNATPEQVLALFVESFSDNNFGTVMVAGKHLKAQFALPESDEEGQVFDITTYRAEHGYRDKRRPDKVTWSKTIAEDLMRRDFTINAIAAKIVERVGTQSYKVEIVDPYSGVSDLTSRQVRAVGDASLRFAEDALRMMRAVRIAMQLNFELTPDTARAIEEHAESLPQISAERIGAEFMKILATEKPADGILLLDKLGLLQHILPELIIAKGVLQSGHHIHDVYNHSIEALRATSATDPTVRLATLLHDIDKPTVKKVTKDGKITFYNHEVVGARTAKSIAARLRLSKEQQNKIFTLVRWHMFHYDPKMTDAAIRRFIRRVGKENIHDMLALRIGDRLGSGSRATSWRLNEMQKRIGEQLYEPLSLRDLAIDGQEVMEILKIKPSRKVGEILNTLFEEILDEPEKNTKEYLSKRVEELV